MFVSGIHVSKWPYFPKKGVAPVIARQWHLVLILALGPFNAANAITQEFSCYWSCEVPAGVFNNSLGGLLCESSYISLTYYIETVKSEHSETVNGQVVPCYEKSVDFYWGELFEASRKLKSAADNPDRFRCLPRRGGSAVYNSNQLTCFQPEPQKSFEPLSQQVREFLTQ